MKFILSLLLLVTLIVKTESIASESPQDVIAKTFELAKQTNILSNAKLKEEIDSQVDFKKMSLAILGPQASKLESAEIQWFEKTIKEIITKTVYPEAPDFLKGVKITYRTTILDNEKATVPSVVSKRGERTDVGYKLEKNNSNQWKIVDVAIDDESWVKTINQNVSKTLNEKGWAGIKDLLNKKVKALNAPKVQASTNK